MTKAAPDTPAFSRDVLDLFDAYVHGGISRRGFLDGAARHVGGIAAATATLSALSPNFANATVIQPDDNRIKTSRVDIPSRKGSGIIRAYIARPAKASKRARKGVVLVVHENRGLNPHIEDITRRLAIDGFIAVAPDALTALGGYPGSEDKARELFGKLDQAKIRPDFEAASVYAQALPESNGKLGAVGFCYGGGMVNYLATKVPGLRAAVPFYGPPAPMDAIAAIGAELLIQLAGNDTRINGLYPPYEAALKAAGKTYVAHIYPAVEHGFNNDTTPRFNKAAADLAWSRTLALFRRQLS